MLPLLLLFYLNSIQHMDLGEIYEEFQNGHHGDHVVYLKRIGLNLNLHIS